MTTENRLIDNNESTKLSESITQLEKTVNPKLNWTVILVLVLLTGLFAVHIYFYDKSNWSLISKFMVCVCPIIIWNVIENKFKGRKKRQQELNELKEIVRTKTINFIDINVNRIVEFTEKDDEGALYLIEQTNGECIYVWDEYLISSNPYFPCYAFDLYIDNTFKYAIEEKIKCKGEKIESIKISGKDKWTYFKDRGFPGDLEIERLKLDEILREIKPIA